MASPPVAMIAIDPTRMTQCRAGFGRFMYREIIVETKNPPSGRQKSTAPASPGVQPCAICRKIGRIRYVPLNDVLSKEIRTSGRYIINA